MFACPGRVSGFLLLGFFSLLACAPAAAQMFSYGAEGPRPVQSLALSHAWVNFTYDGQSEPPARYDYVAPAYGFIYTRPNFSAAIHVGRTAPPATSENPQNLQLLDAALATWGGLLLLSSEEGRARLFLPILLHSQYRRVSQEDFGDLPSDAFGITVLGLGTGVGGMAELGERVQLQGRATPIIGLASRSFGDATGSARLFDADVQLHLTSLVGRFGLSLGYSFRGQAWNVDASNLFQEIEADFYDYRGRQHTLRLGVNW